VRRCLLSTTKGPGLSHYYITRPPYTLLLATATIKKTFGVLFSLDLSKDLRLRRGLPGNWAYAKRVSWKLNFRHEVFSETATFRQYLEWASRSLTALYILAASPRGEVAEWFNASGFTGTPLRRHRRWRRFESSPLRNSFSRCKLL
jgi:hypothetical protein